jgi:hypothetical protein
VHKGLSDHDYGPHIRQMSRSRGSQRTGIRGQPCEYQQRTSSLQSPSYTHSPLPSVAHPHTPVPGQCKTDFRRFDSVKLVASDVPSAARTISISMQCGFQRQGSGQCHPSHYGNTSIPLPQRQCSLQTNLGTSAAPSSIPQPHLKHICITSFRTREPTMHLSFSCSPFPTL